MILYCIKCARKVTAFLETRDKDYWICPHCGNNTACYGNTKRPLGFINTPEIKAKILQIYSLMKTIDICNYKLCKMISEKLGYKFHVNEVKSINECEEVIKVIKEIRDNNG